MRRAVVVAGLAAVLVAVPAGAAAATSATPAHAKLAAKHKAAPAPIVAAGVLGIPSSTDVVGTTASTSVTIPGTAAATWTALVVSVDWPIEVSKATLDASDASGRLGVAVSHGDLAAPQLWVIPLHAQRNRPYTLTIDSALSFRNTNATCGASVSGIGPHLRLVGLRYTPYRGPQTIASYLAGSISRLTLRIPDHAPHDVQQAALRLESAVVARDLDRNVDVNLVSTAHPVEPATLFGRTVTFEPGSKAGISLGGDGLHIAGTGDGLDRQIALLSSKLVPLLQTQSAAAVSIPGVPHVRSTRVTMTQLGISTFVTSGAGNFQLPVGFDQAQTGGEDAGIRFFFHGTNQSPAAGTGATLTLLDGNVPLASTTLGSNGGWQLSGVVPSSNILRYIPLSLQVSYFGGVGSCNALLPLTVSVDPSSYITLTPGQPETPPGFIELPQAFLPHAAVVLSSATTDNLSLAAKLVAGVQRMTTVPLSLDLAPTAALPGTTPAIVVASSGSPLATALRPVGVSNGSAQFTTNSGLTVVQVGPNEALLTSGHGTAGPGLLALVSSPRDPAAASSLLDALGPHQSRWLALGGDTAALAPSGVLATAQVMTPIRATVTAAGKVWIDNTWVRVVIAVVAALLLFLAAQAVLRSRRRAAAGRDVAERDEP